MPKRKPTKPTVLSEQEMKELVMGLVRGMGEDGFTTQDATAVINWGVEMRISAFFLEEALAGNFNFTVENGEVKTHYIGNDKKPGDQEE